MTKFERIEGSDTGASTALVKPTVVGDVCNARDRSLDMMKAAAAKIAAGYTEAAEAAKIAALAHHGAVFHANDRRDGDHYKALFGARFDAAKSLEAYRKQMDASIWVHLLDSVGLKRLMDRQAVEEMERSLMGDVPEISFENVMATMQQLCGDADLIFKRGLANAFIKLDRRFRSHDGFKIGARMILTSVFDEWGHFSYSSRMRETIIDVERVFAVLDGQTPAGWGLIEEIRRSRDGGSLRPHQSVTESAYFRIKGFKNGNAHLWFTRDDLVEKANRLLGEYYGKVMPDAAPKDATAEDVRRGTNLPAKDLQFYPTPEPVVDELLRDLYVKPGDRALEPSAGTGNIVKALVKKGAAVDAIEIHAGRAQAIDAMGLPGVSVATTNFLALPRPTEGIYDFVVMNPPFYGTHWIDHVIHAYHFLKPGGKLVSVLPATAEFGDSKRHEAFHAWLAKANGDRWGRLWRDLPAESFAEAGTRINTVILTLVK